MCTVQFSKHLGVETGNIKEIVIAEIIFCSVLIQPTSEDKKYNKKDHIEQ